MRRGFTLVELMITMTIMVILVSVAIVSLRGTQANGRDAKRTSDTATIARGLEARYGNGMTAPSDGTAVALASGGSCTTTQPISSLTALESGAYPSTEELTYVMGTTDSAYCPNKVSSYITEDLPGISNTNLQPPGSGALILATSATIPSAATVGKNYYYLPLDANGNICSSISTPCTNFTLYYVSEVDGALHTIVSKHQ